MNAILRTLMLGTGAALLLPLAGHTEEDTLGYSYLEGGYLHTKVDADLVGTGTDGGGWQMEGAMALAGHFHLFGRYERLNIDQLDADAKRYYAGLGLNYQLGDSPVDLIGRASWVKIKAGVVDDEEDETDVDDSGYGVSVGLRGRAGQNVELEGRVEYTDVGEFGTDTSVGVAARYFFSPMFAVGVNGNYSSDITQWGAVVRLSFK